MLLLQYWTSSSKSANTDSLLNDYVVYGGALVLASFSATADSSYGVSLGGDYMVLTPGQSISFNAERSMAVDDAYHPAMSGVYSFDNGNSNYHVDCALQDPSSVQLAHYD